MATRVTVPPGGSPAANNATEPSTSTSTSTEGTGADGAIQTVAPADADALVIGSEPQVHLSNQPAPGARPDPPVVDQTLWLGASGGSTLKLGGAETYASGARAFGLGANWLAERYPELNESFFYRFAELTTSAAVIAPWNFPSVLPIQKIAPALPDRHTFGKFRITAEYQ